MAELSSKDQLIAYLSAQGLNNSKIAEAVGCSPTTVALKLNDERIQFEAKHLRYKLYGKDHKKRFVELLPKAIDAAEEVLSNPNIKPQTKLNAANSIMNRALGMPKQTIEHEGSLIRALIDRMDREEPKTKEVIDVESINQVRSIEATNPNDIIDVALTINPNQKEETEVDKWIKNNL